MRQLFRPLPGERGYRAPQTGVEIALAALAVASTAATVIGTISQGQAASAAAGRDADARRRAADLEQQQGQLAYDRQQRLNLINRGKTLAGLAGAGVDPFEGSPLDLLAAQASEGEYQAETAKFQHDQRAWALRMGAANSDAAGDAASSTATSRAFTAGFQGLAKVGAMGINYLGSPASANLTPIEDLARGGGNRSPGSDYQ